MDHPMKKTLNMHDYSRSPSRILKSDFVIIMQKETRRIRFRDESKNLLVLVQSFKTANFNFVIERESWV